MVAGVINGPPTWTGSTTSITNYTNALASFTTNMTANMTATMQSECLISCQSYTAFWHTTLWNTCAAYRNAIQTDRDKVIAGLQGVCMVGCDYSTNLLGASSTPSSTFHTLAGTATQVTSFQQVINAILGNNACNAVVLTQPAPYPAGGVSTTSSLTTCKCDLIMEVEKAMLTNTDPAITAGWQLFQQKYGYDLVEYNILKCVCKNAANNSWTTGFNWSTSPNLSVLTTFTMPVNPKLQCSTCLNCTDVVSAINSLTTTAQLPNQSSFYNVIAAITQDSSNQVFAHAYLNSTLGVHPFQDYLDLYEDCGTFSTPGNTTKTFKNTITQEALDVFFYMKQLVSDHLLAKPSNPPGTRPAKICTDSKYFLSSLYIGSLPNILPYTYEFTASGQTLQFKIKQGITTVLDVTLTGPGTFNTTTWATLISISNMVAWCPSPVSGPNYSFKMSAQDNAFTNYVITGVVNSSTFPVSYLSSGTPEPMYCGKKPGKKNTCANSLINQALTQATRSLSNIPKRRSLLFKCL